MDPLDVTKKLIGGVLVLCFIMFLGYQFILPAATSEAAELRAELQRLSPPPGVRVLNEHEAFSHNGPKHALIEAFYSAHAEPASLVAHYERALRTAGWVVETCGHVAPTSPRQLLRATKGPYEAHVDLDSFQPIASSEFHLALSLGLSPNPCA